MDNQPTTHTHSPTVFNAGDLDWVCEALDHLVPDLGLEHAWCLWVDVYHDDNGNSHPILNDPTLVVAYGHPLWNAIQGKTHLTELAGDLRLPALEALAAIVRHGDELIHVLEMQSYALRTRHGVELRQGCYWRVLLMPQGAVAVVPEDTDGYVERNTAVGLPIGSAHWDQTETIGLGCLGLPAPQSAHTTLETHAKAERVARWVADLCVRVYVGEAEGIVWGAPGNILQP
jgi:hypothetical protein